MAEKKSFWDSYLKVLLITVLLASTLGSFIGGFWILIFIYVIFPILYCRHHLMNNPATPRWKLYGKGLSLIVLSLLVLIILFLLLGLNNITAVVLFGNLGVATLGLICFSLIYLVIQSNINKQGKEKNQVI